MHDYQVCRPGICSSCIVRLSAIRSLVLPDQVFPQNSSSSAHTSSHTKTSHQVQELTLLSINPICGLHKKREMRYASTLLSLFASFVTWKRPELQGRVVTESHDSDTFGDELQWVAEYSEAWLPPLGPIIYKLMAKTVSTFPTTHLEIDIKIFYCFFFQLHLMISKQTTVFNQFIYLIPVGLTLNAPGLSLCLDTLSSWMVSVKAGHGEECSYLEWLEKSSWSHLEQA